MRSRRYDIFQGRVNSSRINRLPFMPTGTATTTISLVSVSGVTQIAGASGQADFDAVGQDHGWAGWMRRMIPSPSSSTTSGPTGAGWWSGVASWNSRNAGACSEPGSLVLAKCHKNPAKNPPSMAALGSISSGVLIQCADRPQRAGSFLFWSFSVSCFMLHASDLVLS
jgi:hypothetical protein